MNKQAVVSFDMSDLLRQKKAEHPFYALLYRQLQRSNEGFGGIEDACSRFYRLHGFKPRIRVKASSRRV